MTVIFFDTETTGLSRTFDQILQFGAIATDDRLEPVPGRRLNLRCRRLPHIVPAPTALALSRVGPAALEGAALSHYDMVAEIARTLDAWEPATYAGYNNMAFDEPQLRQALYQNLFPPYRTTSAPNRRVDIIRMLFAVYIYRRDAMRFAEDARGKNVFRLGPTARANGVEFSPETAHDALHDVEATIALARVVRRAAPDLWDRMLQNGQRRAARALIESEPVLCGGDVVFGRPIQFVATHLTDNPLDGNEAALFDLSQDPAAILDATPAQLARRMRRSPRPVARVRVNRQPILAPYDADSDVARAVAVDEDLARERAALLARHPDFAARVGAVLAALSPPPPRAGEVEEEIHDGLPQAADTERMAAFHAADWPARAEIAKDFKDPRARTLAERLLLQHAPDLLPPARRVALDRWTARRTAGGADAPWLGASAALAELDRLEAENAYPGYDCGALRRYLEELGAS